MTKDLRKRSAVPSGQLLSGWQGLLLWNSCCRKWRHQGWILTPPKGLFSDYTTLGSRNGRAAGRAASHTYSCRKVMGQGVVCGNRFRKPLSPTPKALAHPSSTTWIWTEKKNLNSLPRGKWPGTRSSHTGRLFLRRSGSGSASGKRWPWTWLPRSRSLKGGQSWLCFW